MIFLTVLIISVLINRICCESLFGLVGQKKWDLQLQSIDSKTGKITPIGQKYDTVEAQGLSTVDNDGKIFYTVTLTINNETKKETLYLDGLDFEHGDLVHRIELPFKLEMIEKKKKNQVPNFMGSSMTLDYDPKSKKVIVVGMKAEDEKHYIVTIDPKTKQIKEIGVVSGYINLLWGMTSTYDFNDGILFLVYGLKKKENKATNFNEEYMIVGYDIETGKVVKAMNNTKMMMTMDYDEKTKKIWGVGLIFEKQSRTLLSLDPKTFTFKMVKEYDDYFYLLASISAMNHKDGRYYSYFQKKGEMNYFRLMCMDISDGSIIDQPKCTFAVDCPLAIESSN